MRIGHVIDDATYEKKLNQAVRWYTKRCEALRLPAEHSKPTTPNTLRMAQIVQVVRAAPRPVDYVYVAEVLDVGREAHWHISSRLVILTKWGWLREAGRGPVRYYCKQGALLYEANPPEYARRKALARATEAFFARVDRLDARRMRRSCMASHLVVPDWWDSMADRNALILQRRLSGQTLGQIGDDVGLTKERIRQIVERSIER